MEAKNKQPVFPWYKERLQTKYPKAPTNSSISSCWSFMNMSLDDFSSRSSVSSGVSAFIFHGVQSHKSSQKPTKCISKEHACFSKQMVRKQMRREYVSAVEEKLRQHPLLKHPHYKDHMTPELFDKVVSILDPDMCVNSASALPTPTRDHTEEEDEEDRAEPRKEEEVDRGDKSSHDVKNETPRNPYILQMNVSGVKKGRRVKVNQLSAHKDMNVAARLFSKWFASPNEETDLK